MLLKRQEGQGVEVPGQNGSIWAGAGRIHTTAVHRCARAKERLEGVRGFSEINRTGVKGGGN